MTDDLDHQVRLALRRQGRSPLVPIVFIWFAIGGTACAYLWLNYGDRLRTALFATHPAIDPPARVGGDPPVTRADFDVFQRQTADSLRAATESLEAQKSDLKKLSDQLADLVAKVDALQNAPATASTPAPPRIQNSAPAQPAVPAPRAATARRRKPPAPKPTGPISVGGAPLPPSPNR